MGQTPVWQHNAQLVRGQGRDRGLTRVSEGVHAHPRAWSQYEGGFTSHSNTRRRRSLLRNFSLALTGSCLHLLRLGDVFSSRVSRTELPVVCVEEGWIGRLEFPPTKPIDCKKFRPDIASSRVSNSLLRFFRCTFFATLLSSTSLCTFACSTCSSSYVQSLRSHSLPVEYLHGMEEEIAAVRAGLVRSSALHRPCQIAKRFLEPQPWLSVLISPEVVALLASALPLLPDESLYFLPVTASSSPCAYSQL